MAISTPNTGSPYNWSEVSRPASAPQLSSPDLPETQPFQYDFSQVASANQVRGFWPSLGSHATNALNVMADGVSYAVDEVGQASQGVYSFATGEGYLEGYRRAEQELERTYGTSDPQFMDHMSGVAYVLGLTDVHPSERFKRSGMTAGQIVDAALQKDLGDDKIVSDTIGFLASFATSPGAAIGKLGMKAGQIGVSAPVRLTAQAAKNWAAKGLRGSNPEQISQLVLEGQVLAAAMKSKGWAEMGRRAQKLMAPSTRIGKITEDAISMAGANMAQSYMMSPEDQRVHHMHAALALTPFMLPMQKFANMIGSKVVSADPSRMSATNQSRLLEAAAMLRRGEIDMAGMANAYYKASGVARQATALGLSSAFEGTAFMALDPNARQLAYDWIAKGDWDAGEQLGKSWLGTAMGVAFLKGSNITHEKTMWFRQLHPELNTLDTWIQAESNRQALKQEQQAAEQAAEKARLVAEESAELEARADERLGELTEPQAEQQQATQRTLDFEQRMEDLGVPSEPAFNDFGWAVGETLSVLRGNWTPELVAPAQEGQTGSVRLRFGQDHSVVLRQDGLDPVLEVPENVRQVLKSFGRDPGVAELRGNAARRVLDDLALVGMLQKSGAAINFQRAGMQEVQPGEFAYPGDMKLHSAQFDGTAIARTAARPDEYARVETIQTHGDERLTQLTENPVLDVVYNALTEATVADPNPIRDAVIHNALHMARFSNTEAGNNLRQFFDTVPAEKVLSQMQAGDPMTNLTMDLGSIAANTGNAQHAIRSQRMRPQEAGQVPVERSEQFGQGDITQPAMEPGQKREPWQGPLTPEQQAAEQTLMQDPVVRKQEMEAAAEAAAREQEAQASVRQQALESATQMGQELSVRTGKAGNRQRVREQVLQEFDSVEGVRVVPTSPEQKRLLQEVLPKRTPKGQKVRLRKMAESNVNDSSYVPVNADEVRSAMDRWTQVAETKVEVGEMLPRDADVLDGWFRRTAELFGIDVRGAEQGRPIKYLSLSQRIQLGEAQATSMHRRRAYAERRKQPTSEVQMPGAEERVPARLTRAEEIALREKAAVAEALRQQGITEHQIETARKQVTFKVEKPPEPPPPPPPPPEPQARVGKLGDESGLLRRPDPILVSSGIPLEPVRQAGADLIGAVAGSVGKTGLGRAIRRGYEFMVEDPAVMLERSGVEMGGRAKVVRQDQQQEEASALRMADGIEKLYKSKNKQVQAQLKGALTKEVPIPDAPESMTRTRVADLMDGKLEPKNDTERKIQDEGQKFAKELRNKSAEAGMLQTVSDPEGNLVMQPIEAGKTGVMQYVGGRDRRIVFDNTALRREFFEDLAEANPEYVRDADTGKRRRKTGQDLENEYNEEKAKFSAVVVQGSERQAAVEFSRRFKNYPVYWQHNGKKYEILEPNPLAVMRVMAQQQTGRIATAREFGVHAGGEQTREQLLEQAQQEGWGQQYEIALEKGGVPMHLQEAQAGIQRLDLAHQSDMDYLSQSLTHLSERMQGREPTNTYSGGFISGVRSLQGLRSAAMSSFSFVKDLPDMLRGAYLLSSRRFFTKGLGRLATNWSETKNLAEREGLLQAQTMDWMFQETRSQAVDRGKGWMGKLASWSEQLKTHIAVSTSDLSLRAVESGKGTASDLTFWELSNVSLADMAAIREANTKGEPLDAQVRSRALKAGTELLTSRAPKGEYSRFAEQQQVSDFMVFQRFATKRAQQHGQIIGEVLRSSEKVRQAKTPEAQVQAKQEARAASKRLVKTLMGVTAVGVMGDMLADLLVGFFTEGDPINPVQKFYNEATASPQAFFKQLSDSFQGQVVGGMPSTFLRISEDPTSGQNWAGATTPTALLYAAATAMDAEGSALGHFIDKSGLVPFSRIARGWSRVLQGDNLELRDLSSQVFNWRRDNDAMPATGADKTKPQEFYDAVRSMKNSLYSNGFDIEQTLKDGTESIRQALDLSHEDSVAGSIRGHRLVANLSPEQRDQLFASINDSSRVDAIVEYDNAMTDLAEVIGKMEGKRTSIDEYQDLIDMVSRQAAVGVNSEWRDLADEAIDITSGEFLEGIRNGERLQLLARAYANYPEHLDKVFTGKELTVLQSRQLNTNRRQGLIYRLLMRRAVDRMKRDVREEVLQAR